MMKRRIEISTLKYKYKIWILKSLFFFSKLKNIKKKKKTKINLNMNLWKFEYINLNNK